MRACGRHALVYLGVAYLVFLKRAEPTTLDLSDDTGMFEVLWFNPRTGGSLQPGSTKMLKAGAKVQLGNPPSDPDQDWLAVIQRSDSEQQQSSHDPTHEAGETRSPTPETDASPSQSTYDVSQAKTVHKQTHGIVVVEAEDFDAVDRQQHRRWVLTTTENTPNVKPDPDPSHAEGAVGGAYLEILPDTRVTHSDPLVKGVSFSNVPGQCSVLYYPVEFTEAGRYYVWVRMCCTGSEDNGLHVGLDGKWPESGARLQFTGKHGQWQWDSRQRTNKVHTGVLGKIWLDVAEPGLHTVMFSMREDGFEFDRFLLTKTPNYMKSKNAEPGPAASPKLPK